MTAEGGLLESRPYISCYNVPRVADDSESPRALLERCHPRRQSQSSAPEATRLHHPKRCPEACRLADHHAHLQLNFVSEVAEEHSEAIWVAKDEVGA